MLHYNCNTCTPPTLLLTFLAQCQLCVQSWANLGKQQWLSWQLPATLPAALHNELVSRQFIVQSEISTKVNEWMIYNQNQFSDHHPAAKAKQRRKKQPQASKEESCWWKKVCQEKHDASQHQMF